MGESPDSAAGPRLPRTDRSSVLIEEVVVVVVAVAAVAVASGESMDVLIGSSNEVEVEEGRGKAITQLMSLMGSANTFQSQRTSAATEVEVGSILGEGAAAAPEVEAGAAVERVEEELAAVRGAPASASS